MYLTLTSVVFECVGLVGIINGLSNLTLTSVVFELQIKAPALWSSKLFNFNKCCIWIREFWTDYIKKEYI